MNVFFLCFKNLFLPDDFGILNMINAVRCASHTLQLAVLDVIKLPTVENFIKEIRCVVKQMRNVKYLNYFTENSILYPPLDNITRWGSTYKMINSIAKNQESFRTLGQTYEELKLSVETWIFIGKFQEAFESIYSITLKLQAEQLLMGMIHYTNLIYYSIFTCITFLLIFRRFIYQMEFY